MDDSVSEHLYEWTKISLNRAVSFAKLMGLVDPKIAITETFDGMIAQLSSYVMSDHLEPTTLSRVKVLTYDTPSTWWQHFKLSYPRLTSIFGPPKYTRTKKKVRLSIEVQPKLIFPQAQVQVPRKLGKPVKIYEVRVIDD
jgi:hypothetical protein